MKLLILFIIISLTSCALIKQGPEFDNASLKVISLKGRSIRAIEVINDTTVYFAANDGQIGFTSNSGTNWTFGEVEHQGQKPSFRAIAHTKKAVFILSVANPALLYKWQDGKQKLVYKEEHPDVFYDAMVFLDEANGIAFGDPVNNCFSILKTTDGGNNWTKVKCKSIPAPKPGESAFAASDTNIAVHGNQIWIATGGLTSRVFHSKDKGNTWIANDTPIINGRKMTGIYSVDFHDSKNGIVIGGDWEDLKNAKDNIALTADGGKSWKIVPEETGTAFKSCVQFVPGSRGKQLIAVGPNGITSSKDGGESWQTIHLEGFHTIRMVNSKLAYLAGDQKFGILTLK